MTRVFIRLRADRTVDQDLIVDRPDDYDTTGLIEITGHPQWTGAGSLNGAVMTNGAFVLPQPKAPADPLMDRLATVESSLAAVTAQLDRLEAALASVDSKLSGTS